MVVLRQRNFVVVLFADTRPVGLSWLRALQEAAGGLVLSDADASRLSERQRPLPLMSGPTSFYLPFLAPDDPVHARATACREHDPSERFSRAHSVSSHGRSVSTSSIALTGPSGVLGVLGTLDAGGGKADAIVRTWQLRLTGARVACT